MIFKGKQAMSICPVCGGSGIQRISHLRFRTCLDCLGQGSLSEQIANKYVLRSAVADPHPVKQEREIAVAASMAS
ncbi:MAG: hypothetical protein QF862_00800 [Prochlorococcaceae cyanobacterium ETNP7_MAG_30]|jgi:DnaJ-class molecular chaperone|nr:hypothetical protein [Prochlorococcaceae cyanobacterium ETNP7_MAG_30]|tara:strand:- start:916 stop:1140 length:225 start_codon:yes stop_codon:yes gene_type:complete